MRWEQKLQYATLSDVGLRRQNNEDSAASLPSETAAAFTRRGHLFLVADGMGGHAVGEIASQMAAEEIPSAWQSLPGDTVRDVLREAVVTANRKIHERGSQNRDFLRMGTTCTTLALTPEGAYIAHVGDSRCYRIRRDRIDQLTFDHSLYWEMQRQSRETGIPVELPQHRNIITRSLGPEAEVQVDLEGPFLVLPGDTFVLCSDGLSGEVRDEEIGALAAELPPALACRALIHLANMRGGSDNCTVTIVQVGDLPTNVAPPELPLDFEVAPGERLPPVVLAGVSGLLFALGALLLLTKQTIPGGVLIASAIVTLLVLAMRRWRRKPATVAPEAELSRTNLWKPYRTAVNQPTQELYESLANLEVQVAKVGRDEGWPVNWAQHASAVQAAVEARLEQRFARGVRDLARAIDLLMSAMYVSRRSPRPAAVPERGGAA